MSEWENAFYAENLPADQLNAKWWALCKQYQGMMPPTARSENYPDPTTKTHINDDPTQYIRLRPELHHFISITRLYRPENIASGPALH